jgi:N,N-dimethylformamidase
LRVGDGERLRTLGTGVPLHERRWYQVAAGFDAARGRVTLVQRALADNLPAAASVHTTRACDVTPAPGGRLRFAAWHASFAPFGGHGKSRASALFNGKLEAPRVEAAALDEAGARELMATGVPAAGAEPIAAWDFSRGIPGIALEDTGANRLHGEVFNLPTRAMKGRDWDGSAYDWRARPEHYGAIHFHDDDLYDCAWASDFALDVPADLPSGLYCARLSGGAAVDWVPFVVRPPTGRAVAPLALLLPSASYWAYANRHTVVDFPGREQVRAAIASSIAAEGYSGCEPVMTQR